ncbi:hypothetical protein FN846DRAFT_742840 [Sphaerosporella brunnea]|uniref:Transmembrane protein n=1 Tax=Sphaerosporella brunnea TaxID=1250544 RepID=A0A5J5EWJ7_9PEZI|nr:hypothetical protein FN846DRAFT_742840 [Sphaerosporella brunnea]
MGWESSCSFLLPCSIGSSKVTGAFGKEVYRLRILDFAVVFFLSCLIVARVVTVVFPFNFCFYFFVERILISVPVVCVCEVCVLEWCVWLRFLFACASFYICPPISHFPLFLFLCLRRCDAFCLLFFPS